MAALRLPLGVRTAAAPAPARWAAAVLAGVLVAAAIGVALGPWAASARAGAVVLLVAAAGAVHHVLARRRTPPRGWLVVDDAGVRRLEGGREAALVDWREPFGVTVLASADRSALLIAITSPRATRFVAARVVDAEDAARAPTLVERASTAADGDLHRDDAGLSAADAERLLAEIARRAPGALERAFLSDAAGEPVVLDRTELRVGARRIDLKSALEWRAFVFQELGACAASLCQATWVRQGEVEMVLVAPMSIEAGVPRDARAPDARLMQASAAEPPPRELRRAIDRVFMLPLRRALDRAPRASRAPSPPPRPMPEGRA